MTRQTANKMAILYNSTCQYITGQTAVRNQHGLMYSACQEYGKSVYTGEALGHSMYEVC